MKPTNSTPTTEVKHTQTEKWFVDLGNYHREGDADEIIIRKEMNGELYDVCSMAYDETNFPKDHAELIVKAVNERQALLGALRDAFATLLRWQEQESDLWDERDDETLENIQTAINTANKTLRQ